MEVLLLPISLDTVWVLIICCMAKRCCDNHRKFTDSVGDKVFQKGTFCFKGGHSILVQFVRGDNLFRTG